MLKFLLGPNSYMIYILLAQTASEKIPMVKNRKPTLRRWKCYLGIIQPLHEVSVLIV
jgi:hypothetical protein